MSPQMSPQESLPAERPATGLKPFEPSYGESEADEGLDLRGYWRVLVKRKWTVLVFFCITVAVTATATFLTTPIYRATTMLQIDREAPKVVKYEAVTPATFDPQFSIRRSMNNPTPLMGLLGLFLGYLAAATLVLGLSIHWTRQYLQCRISRPEIEECLKYSLPLVGHSRQCCPGPGSSGRPRYLGRRRWVVHRRRNFHVAAAVVLAAAGRHPFDIRYALGLGMIFVATSVRVLLLYEYSTNHSAIARTALLALRWPSFSSRA